MILPPPPHLPPPSYISSTPPLVITISQNQGTQSFRFDDTCPPNSGVTFTSRSKAQFISGSPFAIGQQFMGLYSVKNNVVHLEFFQGNTPYSRVDVPLKFLECNRKGSVKFYLSMAQFEMSHKIFYLSVGVVEGVMDIYLLNSSQSILHSVTLELK